MPETIAANAHIDLTTQQLIDAALKHHEGVLSNTKALAVTTGVRTGRSPKDRFIVKDAMTEHTVDWGKANQAISNETFEKLWQRAVDYVADKDVYVSHLRVGADPEKFLPVKVVTELAWHNLFACHLFIECSQETWQKHSDPWTILSVPGLRVDAQRDGVNGDAAIILNLSQRRLLVAGTQYAGEMKKGMFSVLNYFLPDQDVLPMHCAANVGEAGDVALFFGLSGTGKTTLSADPERYLIGDDEHGWSSSGVFNFEGGCYAKCIDLSQEREPVIWQAIRDGAIMENVVLDGGNVADYKDGSLTQNTRAAYPLQYIEKRVVENYAGHPKAVLFLTCDFYGVLPPIALLTREQAAYHFLSGYTALIGSTEMGSAAGINPTFSTCFGAPFFPRPAQVYADLLMKRVAQTNCPVYLINTGWTGGKYAHGGQRFSIPVTRAVVRAALTGELNHARHEKLPGFNFAIPQAVNGVDAKVLNPRNTWKDPAEYDKALNNLIEMFQQNFQKFKVTDNIRDAGPRKI